MSEAKRKSRMPDIGEAVFDVGYLIFGLVAALKFFAGPAGAPCLCFTVC